jgi:hypothetical protein
MRFCVGNQKEIFMKKSLFHSRMKLSLVCLFVLLLFWGSQLFAETKNDKQAFTFNIVLTKKSCQIAIWLVNEKGKFVDTVYITRKTAKKGLGNKGGELDDRLGGSRLSVLPVWAHQRGFDYGDGNFYPPKDKALVDAITSATPKAGEFVWTWRPPKNLKPGKYYYNIEVNKSFDDNEHHNYSWYRGQPSVIWQGSLNIGKKVSESEAKLIGHGDVAGKDGKINTDLSSLTTALQLIKKAAATYKPGNN